MLIFGGKFKNFYMIVYQNHGYAFMNCTDAISLQPSARRLPIGLALSPEPQVQTLVSWPPTSP